MTGPLLKSGSLTAFHAVGAVGNPVYLAASQLRAAIARRLGADVADTFAIPQRNEDGDAVAAGLIDLLTRIQGKDDIGEVEIADIEAFKAANRIFTKALIDHPVSQALGTYGSNVLVNIINEAGGLPTKNFTEGQFEGLPLITASPKGRRQRINEQGRTDPQRQRDAVL